MSGALHVTGAGMTAFGRHPDRPLRDLGGEAVAAALADAGLEPGEIGMAFVANSMAAIVTGEVAVVGQGILRHNGFSAIPVYNIDNACAGSSSAFSLAVQALRAGAARNVLVLGAEKLVSPDRSRAYLALNGAADAAVVAASGIDPARESVFVAAIYPPRLQAYAARHGLEAETLARIAVKNRAHAALNPLAQYRAPLTIAEVLASRQVVGPVTQLMCAPIGDGAAALVLSADPPRAGQRPVRILASAVGMGGGEGSAIARTAARAYAEAGLGPADVHLAELHDSIAFNELLACEELGFAAPGQAHRLVAEGQTALGGRLPCNPSGGLMSRGHPVAATGAAQICELVAQLRGEAGPRQVPGARVGLAENAGGFAKDDTAAIAITILGT